MLDNLNDIHPLFYGAPSSTEFKKLRRRIIRNVSQAISDYGMVERDARWLVCLSGGKDSYTLLAALYELKWRGLLPVNILACNLDQGQPNFPQTILPEFLEKMEVPHRIEYQNTYSVVVDKIPEGRTFCSLCSRLRHLASNCLRHALLAALARPYPHCLYFALFSVAAVVTGCSD